MRELSQVVINEMWLNIPGLSQAEADALGKAVIQQITKKVKEGGKEYQSRTMNYLDVRVDMPTTTAKEQMAGIIAEQIYQSLK